MGNIIKFPDDGRVVRFTRGDAQNSAKIIILPVIRIERFAEPQAEGAGPSAPPPPTANGGRRRLRRR